MSKNRICAVIGCNNINYYVYKNPDCDEKRFFRFPRAKSMCIKWIERLNRLDLYPVLEQKGPLELWRNYRVCSDHFLKEDWSKPRPSIKGARKRSACLFRGAIPSRNLGDENEIYVAGASASPLLEEVEGVEEPAQIKAEPVPDLSPIEELTKVEKPRRTTREVIKQLRWKLAMSEELVHKCRLQSKLADEKFEEFDRFKNRYIDYHSVDSCKGKDSCSCQRDFALDLYMRSPQVYKHLQKKFLLPNTSVLYRWKLQKDQETLQKKLELSAEP